MNSFRVLEFANREDRSIWLALWQTWPDREIFAHPNYAPLFAASGDQVVCASMNSGEGGILFPMILRPIAGEPWTGGTVPGWDAISPYGYGGPYSWRCSEEETETFSAGLQKWATEQGVVSLFARLSLFPEQIASFDGEVLDNAPNVVRFLDMDENALWRDYAHKVRKNVNRARASGLRIEIDETGKRLDEFIQIYHDTMQRRNANAGYYFPRDFFEQICLNLNSQFVFFHALSGNMVVSTELVLISARYVYSFLGGTKEEFFDQRPNDLLKHHIILWGRENGKRAFVLGGGYGGPDGIYRYKLSFAPRGEIKFRTGRIIFDQQAYEKLVAMRREWEQQQGRVWVPRPDFFPMYRS
ncbi:MAG TPA: GNAT family N-acetyltransferase [Acidobacteriota bacterium]|nr:GNAT family N-acetyltransferase [Acidobacteriota bacterium]